uniref:Permeases of the major facilitator superfamily n=1 Tax=uncultured gamma proteobacterium HF4000_19M20 TaxID=710987 RepID=E0XVR2_9GAMM|nr:permeases of the major facilitator superfamily [uncultured gamma proteobacterium HF4000_19M20]
MFDLSYENRTLSSGSPWHLFCLSNLYFAQGLPNGFLFFALNTYYASQGATIAELAKFSSLLLLPWIFKGLFAPLIDSFTIRKFGRRRFWILSSQIVIVCLLLPLALLGSDLPISTMGLVVMTINFSIAFLDLSTDALAVDSLEEITLSKANGLMWGSKVVGNAVGMFLGTTLFFAYDISVGIAVLIGLMMIIFLVPFYSRELDFKVGYESLSIKNNFFPPLDLLKEIVKVFEDARARWAIVFILFINLGLGVFEPVYNKFFLEELKWTGEMIGNIRTWSLLAGGATGLFVGLLGTYYQRHLLLFLFISIQITVYGLLGLYVDQISNSSAYMIIFALDMTGAAISVCMFAIFMSLCTSQSSATNFGIFMALLNLSNYTGNQIAPGLMEAYSYSGSFLFCSLALIPAALLTFKIVNRNSIKTS